MQNGHRRTQNHHKRHKITQKRCETTAVIFEEMQNGLKMTTKLKSQKNNCKEHKK